MSDRPKTEVKLFLDFQRVNSLRQSLGDERTLWWLSTTLDAALTAYDAKRKIQSGRHITAYEIGMLEAGRVRVFRLVENEQLMIAFADICGIYGSTNPSIDGRGCFEMHETVAESPDTGVLKYKKLNLSTPEQCRVSLQRRRQHNPNVQRAYEIVHTIENAFAMVNNVSLRARCMSTL